MLNIYAKLSFCDNFNFAKSALGKILCRNAGTCGKADEVFRINGVECREICDVCKEASRFYNVFEAHACFCENCLEVFANLLCLCNDVVACKRAGCGIETDLTGGEEEFTSINCLRIRTDSCRCFRCADFFHNKIPDLS